MLASEDFITTTFRFNGQSFKMEYDLKNTEDGNQIAFGNIYVNGDDDDPISFTFFTINERVAGYTPLNGTKEYISAIVETVLGKKLPVEDPF